MMAGNGATWAHNLKEHSVAFDTCICAAIFSFIVPYLANVLAISVCRHNASTPLADLPEFQSFPCSGDLTQKWR